jgi:hypothetical protein
MAKNQTVGIQTSTVQEVLGSIPSGIVKEVSLELKNLKFEDVLDDKQEIIGKKAIIKVDSTGKEYTVEPDVALDTLYYWRTEKEMTDLDGKLSNLTSQQLTALATTLIAKKTKQIKLQMRDGKVISVRSQRARQVNWKDELKTVFDAMAEVYGLGPELFIRGGRAFDFKLPIASEHLQYFAEIYSGSNIGRDKNRSITVAIRAQTIKEHSNPMEAACMNWCTFREAKSFFKVDVANLSQVKRMPSLGFRAIHTEAGKDKLSKENVITILKDQRTKIEESAKLIDEYVYAPLSDTEIKTFIGVYSAKFKLPKYVADDIKHLLKEKTIWGLSNAFSFFRTHCEYKSPKKDREVVGLTKSLEFIAGELIAASPLIVALQKQNNGQVTKKVLFPNSPDGIA